MVELLRKLPEVDGNPYVIVGKLEGRHLTDLQHPWRRIRKVAGLEDGFARRVLPRGFHGRIWGLDSGHEKTRYPVGLAGLKLGCGSRI